MLLSARTGTDVYHHHQFVLQVPHKQRSKWKSVPRETVIDFDASRTVGPIRLSSSSDLQKIHGDRCLQEQACASWANQDD